MFHFTEEQQAIREMVRDFAEKELKPRANEIDAEARFPAESIGMLAEMGIMGLNIPEEYGGAGLDEISKVLTISELARCCTSTAGTVTVQMLANDIIRHNANEAQKRKYLPMAARGLLGAFSLTEPNAGSDAASIRTRAVQDGDSYVINGTKCFVSNSGPDEGNHFIVITVTDPEKGSHGGMTAFLLDRDTPGFHVGKTENKMGQRAEQVSELILEDCRVPASSVMGAVGDGFRIAMSGLDGGRICVAAQACGLARGALEEAIKYSKERVQFGRPISANQGIQWYLAEMATRLDAAWLLTLRAASMRQNREAGLGRAAAMAKYYATEAAGFVCDLAVQIHGGYGYMKDYPVERMYRDARIMRIYEGTNEVQKTVIARSLLKD